jgi:hypothetical protein
MPSGATESAINHPMMRGNARRRDRLLFAAVVAALLAGGVWAWSRGLDGPYHFDDYTTPVDDPASQSLSAWQTHVFRTLRPLTKLTYALEAETSVTNTPSARRVVSLALHSVSAGLLLLLILRLVPRMSPYVAAALAGIWFVHPVHADAVLLASGRTAVLSTLFVTAALLALDRSRPWRAAVLFGWACLSRETAIAAILPLAVLSAARHPGDRRAMVRELVPILAAAAVIAGWMLATPRYRQLADYSMLGRPFWASVIKQVGAVPVGLRLLVQPSALSIDYGIPLPARFGDPLFLAGVSLYTAAAGGVLLCARRSVAAAVGLALWLAALLPTQSVIPKLDALANRPLSLALAGLLVAVAPLVDAALSARGEAPDAPIGWSRPRRWRMLAATGSGVVVVMSLVAATAARAELFQSELRVWHDAAAKSRVNERPYVHYAVLLKQEGKDSEAIDALSVAARINPFSSQIAAMSRLYRLQETSR